MIKHISLSLIRKIIKQSVNSSASKKRVSTNVIQISFHNILQKNSTYNSLCQKKLITIFIFYTIPVVSLWRTVDC